MAKTKQRTIEPRYLTLQQAGDYLGGRSAEAVRMMCKRGRLLMIKQGTRIFVDRFDIDRSMAAARLAGEVAK